MRRRALLFVFLIPFRRFKQKPHPYIRYNTQALQALKKKFVFTEYDIPLPFPTGKTIRWTRWQKDNGRVSS